MRHSLLAALVLTSALSLSGCGYNTLQSQDEAIKANWSEVLNQYQRRADLVPNLVNTVKGYAAHEAKVLTEVTAARAKVGQIAATPELANDPAALKKFQAAQGELSSALSRLLVVSENYPQLKADAGFRDRALESSPWAAWNFFRAAGSLASSGVAAIWPTLARAAVTSVSTLASWAA